jgi:hypothetical protein
MLVRHALVPKVGEGVGPTVEAVASVEEVDGLGTKLPVSYGRRLL